MKIKILKKLLIDCLLILSCISFHSIKLKASLNINCLSYCLMEANSKRVISGNNINTRHLTASICKVLTAIVVIENTNIYDYCVIDYDTVNQEGSKIYLEINDIVMVKDLLAGLLLRSGNDCSYALAKKTSNTIEDFVVLMNNYAKKIGMVHSIFSNPSGLDSINENYSTAYDMALLMAYCMDNSIFKEISENTKYTFVTGNNKHYVLYNKHKLVNAYDYVLAGKTGYTKKAHRTLISYASKNDMNLICVTFDCVDDWATHIKLFEYGYKNYSLKTIMKSQAIRTIDTKKDYQITPYLKNDIILPLANDEKYLITIYLKEDPFDLDIVGILVITINEEIVYKDCLNSYF